MRAHHAAKTVGIRLVVGVRLDLATAPASSPIPQDRAAYGRLTRLLTLGKRRAPKGECHLDYADVVAHGEGQIVIVLPPEDGQDATSRHSPPGSRRISPAAPISPRIISIAATMPAASPASRVIADETGLPLVAVNDVLYHVPERRPLQDVVTCIREHCTIAEAGFRLAANAERHLKPAAEMARLFRGYEDAVARSLEIVERCRFSLDELRYEYPRSRSPTGMTPQQRLAATDLGRRRRAFHAALADGMQLGPCVLRDDRCAVSSG